MDFRGKALLAVAAAAVVAGGVYFGVAHFGPGQDSADAPVRVVSNEAVEQIVDKLVADDPYWTAFEDAFPTDWATIRSQIASDLNARQSYDDIRQRVHLTARETMLRYAIFTAEAPTPTLLVQARAELAFVEQLQRENAQYCAEFALGGLPDDRVLSPQARKLADKAARAGITATRQGIDTPQQRPRSPREDWIVVHNARQRAGLVGQDVASASASKTCAFYVHLSRGIASMPPEQSARLFATLMVSGANALRATQSGRG